jgi:hypothetical protein
MFNVIRSLFDVPLLLRMLSKKGGKAEDRLIQLIFN